MDTIDSPRAADDTTFPMIVDAAALERFRDEIIVAVGAIVGTAIRESEQRIRAELVQAMAASEERMRREFGDAMHREIGEAIAASEARLEARLSLKIEASAAETRRHMGVLAEDLKSKIALVAEGLITLTGALDTRMQRGFEVIDRRLLRVETRLFALGPS